MALREPIKYPAPRHQFIFKASMRQISERKEISITCRAGRLFLQESEKPIKSHPPNHHSHKCIQNAKNKTSNKILPGWLLQLHTLSEGRGNGGLVPPIGRTNNQQQDSDGWQIWCRGGKLSKAKGRREIEQASEGGQACRKDREYGSHPQGTSRRGGKGVRPSEVRGDKAWAHSVVRRNHTSWGRLGPGGPLCLLMELGSLS